MLAASCFAQGNITQEELVRRTQELADAVASGDQRPWQRYFADDCMFFDEKGRGMDKRALVADITPLPPGLSGTIKVVQAESHIEGADAILAYDLDETEIVYGQIVKARYHETDTWMRRSTEWKIIASQVSRYYKDPAPGAMNEREVQDFLGRYEVTPGKILTVTHAGALVSGVARETQSRTLSRDQTRLLPQRSRGPNRFSVGLPADL